MNPNEEFAAKLACPKCSRPVKKKSKWLRLQKSGDSIRFHYRCARCYSEFEGIVSAGLLARLKELRITGSTDITDRADTTSATDKRQIRNGLTWFFLPTFGKKRKEQRAMRRYQMAFEHALWSDGNDYLSHVIKQEGNNWKTGR